MQYQPHTISYPQLLFIADCYKYTHAAMYPSGVEEVYSVLYCRNPRLDLRTLNGHIVAFGMRQAIKKLYGYIVNLSIPLKILCKQG